MSSSKIPHLIQSYTSIKEIKKKVLDHFYAEKEEIEGAQKQILLSYAKCISNLENLVSQSINYTKPDIEKINNICNFVIKTEEVQKYEEDPIFRTFTLNSDEIDDYLTTLEPVSSGWYKFFSNFFTSLEKVTEDIVRTQRQNIKAVNYSYLLSLTNNLNNIINEKKLFLEDSRVLLQLENQDKETMISANLNWRVPALLPVINNALGLSKNIYTISHNDQELKMRFCKYKKLHSIGIQSDDLLQIVVRPNEKPIDTQNSPAEIEKKNRNLDKIILNLRDEFGDMHIINANLNWKVKEFYEKLQSNFMTNISTHTVIFKKIRIELNKNLEKTLEEIGVNEDGDVWITGLRYC